MKLGVILGAIAGLALATILIVHFGWREIVDAADALEEEDDGAALDALPIDPYAAHSPGEFFAVTSEAFGSPFTARAMASLVAR